MTVDMHRAAERFRTARDGIVTYSSFAAGSHYDSAAVAFGTLIGLDEHLVAPGAGFPMHGHRAVHIVSVVLDGVLTHEDTLGNSVVVPAPSVAHLTAGAGVRHEERNDGPGPLRLVQATVLGSPDVPPRYEIGIPPLRCAAATLHVLSCDQTAAPSGRTFGFVARGELLGLVAEPLQSGDSFRIDDAGEPSFTGSVDLLLIVLDGLD